MKLRYFLAIWVLFYLNSAHAAIYKLVDADGHVTYSSTPLKGSKKLHLAPLPTVHAPARSKDSAADFPKVDSVTQKNRDNTRKQILEGELASEEKALAEARNNLQAGTENLDINSDKDGKMSALQEQVQLHEKNIAALKTELSKINK
jgi:small-conductance mechanosensitive channel